MTKMHDRHAARYGHYRLEGQREQGRLQATGYLGTAKAAAKPWWWRFDPVLLVLIVAFVAFEVVAHFHFHNANGWMTLSNRIVNFQRHYGWPARVIVYGGLIVLGIHLWGGVF